MIDVEAIKQTLAGDGIRTEMTFIDLFSGHGGFRVGMERAGHKCVGFCEFDKFSVLSYMAMHLTTPEEQGRLKSVSSKKENVRFIKQSGISEREWYANDIRTVRSDDVPYADCWCAGFPCQDISIAGKLDGLDGERSGLYFAIIRILKGKKQGDKPTYLFIENVRNLLSVSKGWDFLRVLAELDAVGYDARWSVINSTDVVGQNRVRVFIVATLRGRSCGKVFPIAGSNETSGELQGQQVNTLRAKYANNSVGSYVVECEQPEQIANPLKATYSKTMQTGSYIAEVKQIGNLYGTEREPNPQAGRVYDPSGISLCLDTCQGGNRTPKIAIPCLTPDRENKRQNGRRFKDNGDPMLTLTAQDRHGVAVSISMTQHKFKPTEVANTLTARGPGRGRGNFSPVNGVLTFNDEKGLQCVYPVEENGEIYWYQCGIRLRKLTVLECFRLQTMPDQYYYLARSVNSDSQLYKQVGNSVTCDVVTAIAVWMWIKDQKEATNEPIH